MIKTTEHIADFDTFCETLNYAPDASLFFDIETTGFVAASSTLFLIGALYREAEGWILVQFLAETREEERLVLEAFLELAARFTTLIHFNGNTFDLPFIRKKAEQYKLSYAPGQHISLDLYQTFRPLRKLPGVQRLNQSSLENWLGWQRTDRLTGKQVAALFDKYAACKEPEIQKLLLLHNRDDMVGMTKLLQLSSCLMLFHGVFSCVKDAQRTVLPDGALCLQIRFSPAKPLPRRVETEGTYRLLAEGRDASLTIPICESALCHFFEDYRNYYYLPLEDQAVHKSVAAFVDKQYRIPATAANCYIKKSGRFLPQPGKIFTPVFRHSCTDPQYYFECTEEFLSDTECLSRYLSAMLQHLDSREQRAK